MKELLSKFLDDGVNIVSPEAVFISMGVTLGLSILLYITYMITFSGVTYSEKFNVSLIMLALITSMVMNIIGSSVALSLGMVGALSIVRFRTAIKDPRDTAYIFWAICIGLGTGTSNYYIVGIGTVFIMIITTILSFSIKNDEGFLIIIRSNKDATDEVRSVLFKTYRACKLRSETIVGGKIELVYQVKLKKNSDIAEYEKIQEIKGVTMINMVAKNGEILG